jgi:hypothetical protein
MEGLEPKPLERIVAYNAKARPGRSYLSMNLREEIHYGKRKLDGTMLPTPQTRDWKGAQGRASKTGAMDVPAKVEGTAGTKTGLKLQPGFALWMMGYPTDWCDLKDGEMPPSKARGTRGSRKLQ